MTPLEIRLLSYIAAGLLYSGLLIWGTVTLTSHHFERVEAADKLAQASAIQVQQQKTLDDLKAQQVATQAAEQKYVELKANNDRVAQQFADSLRAYQGLRASVLSAASSTAALADAARAGADRDTRLAELARSAVEACQNDAAQLTALQQWAQGTPALAQH